MDEPKRSDLIFDAEGLSPAALEKKRPVAVLRQHQCAEKPGGTGPDHHRSLFHLFVSGLRKAVLRRFHYREIFAAEFRDTFFFRTQPDAKIRVYSINVE